MYNHCWNLMMIIHKGLKESVHSIQATVRVRYFNEFIYITFENVSPHLYDTNKPNKTKQNKKKNKTKAKTLSA